MAGQSIPVSVLVSKQFAVLEQKFGADPFTTWQASALGVRSAHLHRLVQTGHLKSTLYCVFQNSEASNAGTVSERARQLALVLPSGAAIARRTAAWLYGVDPRTPDEAKLPLPLECIVNRGHTPVRRPGVFSYQSDLPAAEVSIVGGLPCTTVTRTAADLLRWLRPHMALATADALARHVGLDMDGLAGRLDRWAGQRYVRQARRLAEAIDPMSESYGESWLRLRILDAGFPRPTAQIAIEDDGGHVRYRLDLGWPELKLGVEYDGLEFHSGPKALQADQRRRQDLADRFGWHVVGVGRGEVLGTGLRLERGLGELLGMEPAIRRRSW